MTSHAPAKTRRERFARRYPRLYALRHVAKGTGKAAAALIGIGLLLQLLPAIPWPDIPLPSIDLPEIPWPDIPLPSIDLPEITMPAWLRAILEAKKYWLPILIGIVLAVRELKRRQRPGPGESQRSAVGPPPPSPNGPARSTG